MDKKKMKKDKIINSWTIQSDSRYGWKRIGGAWVRRKPLGEHYSMNPLGEGVSPPKEDRRKVLEDIERLCRGQ
jgi:hypothetical protein